jgi:hypothetical protein
MRGGKKVPGAGPPSNLHTKYIPRIDMLVCVLSRERQAQTVLVHVAGHIDQRHDDAHAGARVGSRAGPA